MTTQPQAQLYVFDIIKAETPEELTELINARAADSWEALQCWAIALTYTAMHYCLMRKLL